MEPSQWHTLSQIDPDIEAAIKGLEAQMGGPLPRVTSMTPEGAREFISHLNPPAPDPPVAIEEWIAIPARDGHQIPILTFKPLQPVASGSPVAVLFFAGGWTIGSPELEATNARNFASQLGMVCFSVGYRLAPENPFPASINDCWDAVKWVAANAEKFGAAPGLSKGFICCGSSAGGNLTDVVGHLSRDEKLSPPVTGLIEIIPFLVPALEVPEKYKQYYNSMEENKDAPNLSAVEMDWFQAQYNPDVKSELFNTFNNPRGHAGLPPVVLQVAGLDPLRDEALIYERVLRENGVKTKLFIYPGAPHAFHLGLRDLPLAQKHYADTVEGARWLLDDAK